MRDLEATIISQFANSPRIRALIANMDTYLDPSVNIDLFYTSVMNIDTAGTYGLDVWGRIVGVTRVVQIAADGLFFGFGEAGVYNVAGFYESTPSPHHGSFWDGEAPTTQPYELDNDSFRLLVLAKALFNITDCSIPAINQILLNLFPGRGNCWVRDNLDMTLTYCFSFVLTAVEYAILGQSGALPRPAGVLATVETV